MPLSWSQLLSPFNPMDHVFTGVYEAENESLKCVGQIYQAQELDNAQLHFLVPLVGDDKKLIVPLLEGLITQAGNWGAKQVTADLTVDSDLFTFFRQAGFSVLAKQRVFCFESNLKLQPSSEHQWQIWKNDDIKRMRNLHATLVPPVIQSVEPLTRRKKLGLVFYDSDNYLRAYADLVYGPAGVWVLPFMHPQTTENALDLLVSLINTLPDVGTRPVYIVTRSYQPWIENALSGSPGRPGPEQAMLVRYIASRQKVKAEFTFGAIENGNPEPTVPLAPIRNNQD